MSILNTPQDYLLWFQVSDTPTSFHETGTLMSADPAVNSGRSSRFGLFTAIHGPAL